MSDIYDEMARAWKAPAVARSDVKTFSGGALSGKTLANLASKGEGPPSFRFRGRVCYVTRELASWMREWNQEAA